MSLGLWVEDVSIRWLTDRFGCDYNRLQKFAELEARHKQITDQKKAPWGKTEPPKYNVDRYINYYSTPDFHQVRRRFDQATGEATAKEEMPNHVPHKTALRIREAIMLSV